MPLIHVQVCTFVPAQNMNDKGTNAWSSTAAYLGKKLQLHVYVRQEFYGVEYDWPVEAYIHAFNSFILRGM